MDVAVLEPVEVLRCGLETMLRRLEGISTLECHRSMDELLFALEAGGGERNSDIVIVTCSEADDIVGRVRGAFPASRVLELVNSVDPEHLALAASTHADGYLMVHDITDATLDSTLRALICGGCGSFSVSW